MNNKVYQVILRQSNPKEVIEIVKYLDNIIQVNRQQANERMEKEIVA